MYFFYLPVWWCSRWHWFVLVPTVSVLLLERVGTHACQRIMWPSLQWNLRLFWVLDVLKLSGVGQAPFHLYHSLLRDLVHSGDLCPFGLAVQFQPTKRFALPASLTDSEYSYQDRRTWLEISSAFCGEPWKPTELWKDMMMPGFTFGPRYFLFGSF